MIKQLRKLTQVIFNQPFLYHTVRPFFVGGLPTRPVLELLQATSNDDILDVGCGSGFISKLIPFHRYVGVDDDASFIEIAVKHRLPNTQFILGNVNELDWSKHPCTKVILYGVLHHLSDADCIKLLNTLATHTSKWIVTLDPVYTKHHFINNILARLDRGRYVRHEAEMMKLLAATQLRIEKKMFRYANTKIVKYILFRLVPSSKSVDTPRLKSVPNENQ